MVNNEISKRPAPTIIECNSFPESPGESSLLDKKRPSFHEVQKTVTTVQPELQFDTDPHTLPEASNEAHKIDPAPPTTTVSQADDVESAKSGGRVSSVKLTFSDQIPELSTSQQEVVQPVPKVDPETEPKLQPTSPSASSSPPPPSTVPPSPLTPAPSPPSTPKSSKLRRSGRTRKAPDRLQLHVEIRHNLKSTDEFRLGSSSAI